MSEGLENRYEVRKVNDPDGKHDDCRYFVLDPEHDLAARGALEAYARNVAVQGYDELAADIMAWLAEVRGWGGAA